MRNVRGVEDGPALRHGGEHLLLLGDVMSEKRKIFDLGWFDEMRKWIVRWLCALSAIWCAHGVEPKSSHLGGAEALLAIDEVQDIGEYLLDRSLEVRKMEKRASMSFNVRGSIVGCSSTIVDTAVPHSCLKA